MKYYWYIIIKKKKLEKIKKLKFLNLFDFKKKSLNADC